jgi:hypothetical protein
MEAVYKYVLGADDTSVVEMPQGAKILSTAFQGDDLCVWALVGVGRQTNKRVFHVRGTGHDARWMRSKTFVGTAFHPAGLVFHVFEG